MNELSSACSFIIMLCVCWQACQAEMGMRNRATWRFTDILYMSTAHNGLQLPQAWASDLSCVHCKLTQYDPWRGPQQESADGLPLRELQEVTGASLQNFGKGILPSVGKISAVQWLAIQLTGATRPWVGGDRQRAPCQQLHPCRKGCLDFPSIHPLPYPVYLSHALRTADCIYYIFAYIWAPLFCRVFKLHTLYWDYMRLRTESERCHSILKSEDNSGQCCSYCQFSTSKR